ncbi:hypothetical protein [Actinomadura rugatobispora]|uniref:Uncharacterized protein n=1 Tax=Actinomadura rugatobispora TaxID=1994 RepID=A0ABW1AEP2_9ACTN|nr:hypothetical protein GCM10010200_054270 [Actinomadura rugatobispora]
MIDYQVQEFGKTIARGSRGIDIFWLDGLDQSRIPMLRHLLPYADTMFNSSQVSSLAEELDGLPEDNPLVPEIRDELKRLCEHVSAGAHRQLWFLGD